MFGTTVLLIATAIALINIAGFVFQLEIRGNSSKSYIFAVFSTCLMFESAGYLFFMCSTLVAVLKYENIKK